MFKLGEYSEVKAKTISGYLKDAGFKVDTRGMVFSRSVFSSTLMGRLSEVEGKVKDIDRFRKYASAVKTVLEKKTGDDDLAEAFLSEVLPGWEERLERLKAAKKEMEAGEGDYSKEDEKELIATADECISASNFLENFVEINKIDVDNPGSFPDDPILTIPVDSDDYEDDDPLLHMRMDVVMKKAVEIAVDEFSTTHYDKLDNDFGKDFPDEFGTLKAMGILMVYLVESAEKGKMDMEDFAELCSIELGKRTMLTVDATLVAEEIARSLEKAGILKMKGDTIKWRI